MPCHLFSAVFRRTGFYWRTRPREQDHRSRPKGRDIGDKRVRDRVVPVVAVGTTITDRPPHRSVHARLRIRLLPRMNGVEALVGIRMQNTWVRNAPVEQWVETVPSHLRALTATD